MFDHVKQNRLSHCGYKYEYNRFFFYFLLRILRLYFPPLSDRIERLKPFRRAAELASLRPICLRSIGCGDPGLQAPPKHLTRLFFVLTRCFSSQLSRRDTPTRCSVSRRGCLPFCAALARERPSSNLQKHTAARCQG